MFAFFSFLLVGCTLCLQVSAQQGTNETVAVTTVAVTTVAVTAGPDRQARPGAESVFLPCRYTGREGAPPSVRWWKEPDTPGQPRTEVYDVTNDLAHHGYLGRAEIVDQASLRLLKVTLADAGTYVCTVERDGGYAEGSVRLGVQGCSPTPRDVQGPYYLRGVPHQRVVCRGGPYMLVKGTVRDSRCSAVPKATLEVWQADPAGCYKINPERPSFCRGKVRTDAQGRFSFLTVRPGKYGSGWWQARPVHVHFRVTAPRRRTLVTQMYFSNNLGEKDPCKFCGSDNPSQLTKPRPPSSDEKNYKVGGTRYRIQEVTEWDIVLN
ncbi:chlorocatechol 1,2-dioxygenase-like [Branchiostoma floridae x Branchiostoma japonicum]